MFELKPRIVVALVIGLASVLTATQTLAADSPSSSQEVIEQDRERIQAHLKEVERRLRSKDVSHLSAEKRRARERNLDRLHEYWKQGVFPHNSVTKQQRPIFIDPEGRECAVAYLMEESGWEEEAHSISARENLAYIAEMESPEVAQWVRQSGLTAEEAALIQPTYCHLDTGYGSQCGSNDAGHGVDTGDGTDEDTGPSDDTASSDDDASGKWSDASDEPDDDGENADRSCSIAATPAPGSWLLLGLLLLPAAIARGRRN